MRNPFTPITVPLSGLAVSLAFHWPAWASWTLAGLAAATTAVSVLRWREARK